VLNRTTIYIHNIQMLTSIAFESRFENFLRRMVQEKQRNAKGQYSNSAPESEQVFIEERRIMVSANNTWKNITDDTYVSMGAPNQQGVSLSGGTLAIKNFICHPLVALIMRVEYKASITLDKHREQVFFTLGFTAHLPAFNAAGDLADESLDVKFILGPGQAPNGELLWDPNADDKQFYQVRMRAYISSSAAPPMDYQGFPVDKPRTAVPIQAAARPLMPAAPISSFASAKPDPKTTEALVMKDKQIKELEQRMLDLQRREQNITSHAEALEIRSL